MKLYSCRVRLNGDRDHEVNKQDVTAAEIKVLEALHVSDKGFAPVVAIVHTGDVTRSDAKERDRLSNIYSKGELVENRGEKIIQQLFGFGALPQEYTPPVHVTPEVYEADDEEEEVITRLEKPEPVTSIDADVIG